MRSGPAIHRKLGFSIWFSLSSKSASSQSVSFRIIQVFRFEKFRASFSVIAEFKVQTLRFPDAIVLSKVSNPEAAVRTGRMVEWSVIIWTSLVNFTEVTSGLPLPVEKADVTPVWPLVGGGSPVWPPDSGDMERNLLKTSNKKANKCWNLASHSTIAIVELQFSFCLRGYPDRSALIALCAFRL